MRRAFVLVSLLLAGLAGPAAADDLADLAAAMTGRFSSAAQAAADPDYHAVVLTVVPIWAERDGGPWLYVEQALASRPERPYRQRVYQLARRDDGALESRVFLLPDPAGIAGAGTADARWAALAPDQLLPRLGCTVVLRRRADGSFAGGTEGTGCASDLQGALYATSEVVLTRDRMESWDRGFAADGTQVWGATKGPYMFDRIADPES